MSSAADIESIDSNRYQTLVGAITDYAVFMLDNEGNVASWNPGAKRFKGYDEAEILGQHFSRFYTEEDRLSQKPELTLRSARTEGRFEAEGWRIRKDGHRFWAHVVVDPICTPSGEVVGFAKITRDISARHRAQVTLDEAVKSLR